MKKKYMKNRLKARLFYVGAFAISMVIRMLQISGNYQMRLIADDIGMLSYPAYLAGYNWSDVTAHTSYYGVAYYMLFTPVLKFVNNPCTVWYIIVLANIMLEALTCMLSYHIAICYFKFKADFRTMLAAVICSLTVVNTYSVMTQEPALYFLTWLITYLLIKMVNQHENKTRQYLYSAALALTCAYAYLVHARAIVFIVALLFAFVIILYYDRNKIKSFLCFILALIIMMIFANLLQKKVISILWGQTATNLSNVKITINQNTIKTMLTPEGIRVLIDMTVSNLFTAAGKTFGINLMAIVMGGLVVVGMKVRKCAVSITQNEKIILLFSLACYLLGVLGISVTWGKRVVPVYFTGPVNYSYKGFIYFRYAATFLGPAALIALGECLHNKEMRIKMKLPTLAAEISIVWYFILFVIEKIKNSGFVNGTVVSYFDVAADGFDIINYRITVLMIAVFSCLVLAKAQKPKRICITLVLCILCCVFPYIGKGESLLGKPQLNAKADGGYNLIKFLEEKEIFPNAIYSPSNFYAYQFHLKEYPILAGYPKDETSEIMFFTTGKKTDAIPDTFKAVQLDDNEWVWTNDHALYEIIVDYVNRDK